MPTTILVYGRSGVGKSYQIANLAEDHFIKTSKITRVYSADFGGSDVMAPHEELGILEIIPIGSTNPWIFANRASRGYVRDKNGKWVEDKALNSKVGIYAFESAHGLAQLLKVNMNEEAAKGSTIGGDTNSSFQVSGDGDSFKVGSVKGYQQYAIPQQEILRAMYQSFKLPADYIIWSAGVDAGSDELGTSKVVGPAVIGGALTAVLPKDFHYTFHMDVLPGEAGKAARHILYLGAHQDKNSGSATALGNIRRPRDAGELKDFTLEPSDLVKALQIVREQAKETAKQAIQKRLEAAKKLQK